MKQVFKSLVLVASVAASLISCQKEQNSPVDKDIAQTVKLTVHASAENLKSDTKTYIDSDGKTIFWGSGEYMTAALIGEETFATYNSTSESADIWEGGSEAMFEFDVEASTGSVTYGGIYPTSAVVESSNTNAEAFKVNLPANQNATASSYDPAAYIMIAKPETFEETTTDWEASFRRATALNKITLTNLADDITSVKITIPAEKYLAGRRYMDLTTGDKGEVYSGGGRTNAITINYSTPIASGVEAKDIWFTSWGVEIPEGAKMTIVAYSDDFSYTREITARKEGIIFNEGFLNTLSINMASAEKEPLEKLEGDYAVLVAQNDVYYILSSTNTINSTRLDAVEFTGYEAATEYTSETPLQIVDPNFVWTISLDENSNYTLKNGSNYLSYSGSDNTAKVDAEPYALTIVKEDGGKYNISSVSVSGRRLAKNSSSKYFAFYGGSQEKEIILVPARYVRKATAPEINYEKTTSTVTITAEEGASVYYTTDGTNPTESSTKVEYTEPFTLAQTATVKAYATLEGCLDSDVASKECVVGQNTPKYVKVTANKDDWSGTYLIVSGTNAFKGTISTTSTKYGQIATVTVSNDAIESTTTIDGYKVVVEKSGDNYTIKTNSNGYLYWTSGNSLNASTTLQQDNKSLWDFTFNDGGTVCITNVNTDTRVIRFNSDRFACYTTATGSIPNLYELEDNRTSQTLTFTGEEGTIDLNGNVQNLPTLDATGAFTTITYSSSDETIATVNPNTGAVTAKKVGTATITATAAESSTYKKATASYNLTVVDTTPIINASNPAAVEADATSVEVPYTVTNKVVGTNLTATVTIGDWISNPQVEDNNVTFTLAANTTSEQRTGTVTLSYAGAADKVVTITQKGAGQTGFASLEDLVAAGAPTDANVTVTFSCKAITKFQGTGDNRKGIYLSVQGAYNNEVEIYCNTAATPEEWVVGGWVSGTLTDCKWTKYNNTWELCPSNWDEIDHFAPVAQPKITLTGANAKIACDTEGATILYAVSNDGNQPESITTIYNNSVTLEDGQTIWAKAIKTGFPESGVAYVKYTVGGSTPTYKKVSSFTVGKKYILVVNNYSKIFDGGNVSKETTAIDATSLISNNEIESNSTTDSYAITIESSTTSGKYLLKLSTSKYLVINASTSKNGDLTSSDTGESISINTVSGGFQFVSTNRSTRGVCYRDGYNFRNYATSNFSSSGYSGTFTLYEYTN